MMDSGSECNCKTPEQILEDLKNISPLALPAYLAECEYYDRSDAYQTLDRAIREFEQQGGLVQNLMDVMLPTSVQAVGTVILKYTNKSLYTKAQRGKINFGAITNRVINFEYDEEFLRLSTAGDELLHYQQKTGNSGISDKYNRDEWDSEARKGQFKGEYNDNVDALGQPVYKDKEAAAAAGANYGKDALTVDHIVPLKQLHEQYGSFAQRYAGQAKMNEIANSDENFQALNQSSNSSKNDKTNTEFIAAIKNRLEKKPDDPEAARKQKVIDSEAELKKNEQKASSHVKTELLKSGAGTVAMEQLGRLVEVFVGPVSFEIRESVKHGICHNLNTDDILDAIFKRIMRVFKYMVKKLPALIGDALGDLSQMLVHLGASILGLVTGIFKQFIGMVMSGISIIIEAVKVCCSKDLTPARKGDAISKLIVTLVVNVLGNFVLQQLFKSLGVPEFLGEILTPLLSALLSAIIVYLFNSLDLFNLKKELRQQRIDEIFELRRQKLAENKQMFTNAVAEKLKQERMALENIRMALAAGMKNKDFKMVDQAVDDLCKLFQVEVPYRNFAEFADFLKDNPENVIA